MEWIITNDIIGHEVSFKRGTVLSIGTARVNFLDDIEVSLPFTFQLKDDDDNIYFIGRSSDASSEEAFEPLDWAMLNYGCTSIEYLVGGKWEVL